MMLSKNAKTYAEKVITKVANSGIYINGTREVVGFTDKILPSPSFWHKRSGADVDMMLNFFDRVLAGELFTVGPYNSFYYTFLSKEIKNAGSQFNEDGPYTRRAVVNFPEGHCFTSIQVLVRPGTFESPGHKATIIVNMRSCNVEANFANDLFLAYLIGTEIIHAGFGKDNHIEIRDMLLSIGSLHKIIIKQ